MKTREIQHAADVLYIAWAQTELQLCYDDKAEIDLLVDVHERGGEHPNQRITDAQELINNAALSTIHGSDQWNVLNLCKALRDVLDGEAY